LASPRRAFQQLKQLRARPLIANIASRAKLSRSTHNRGNYLLTSAFFIVKKIDFASPSRFQHPSFETTITQMPSRTFSGRLSRRQSEKCSLSLRYVSI